MTTTPAILATDATHVATWRDGIHLTGTAIWCDAPRRRDLCFASAVDAFGRIRHGQLFGTEATLALVRGLHQAPLADSELAVPLARPFSLGGLRLELFASGHALGGAALRVEGNGRTVIYARGINPLGTPLAGKGDARRADVVIVSGVYSHPRYVFQSFDAAIDEIADRAATISGRGGACGLLVTSSTKALDIANALAEVRVCHGHPRFAKFARSAQQLGLATVKLPTVPRQLRPGTTFLWPLGVSVPTKRLPRGSELIVVSGLAVDPQKLTDLGASSGVAVSDHADHMQLIQFIEGTGAKRAILLGEPCPLMEKELSKRGITSSALGPPTQLELGVDRIG